MNTHNSGLDGRVLDLAGRGGQGRGKKNFSLLQNAQHRCHPPREPPIQRVPWAHSAGIKRPGHLRLEPKLGMSGATPLLSQFAFTVCRETTLPSFYWDIEHQ